MKQKIRRRLWLGFDRALSQNLTRQLVILLIVLAVALGLSYLFLSWSNAEWESFCKAKDLNKWLLPLYLLIDSNALNTLYIEGGVHGWMLFASSVTFLIGAFIFNGVIIGVITNSIDRRVMNHQEGHIYYLTSGHYIVMGFDDMVTSFILHVFNTDPKAYVLLLTSAETTAIREKLAKSFSEQQMRHIIINYGHRISTETFADIHLEKAQEVFVVGNHQKPAHDAINVECVDSICRYLGNPDIKDRPERITCVFKDFDTYTAFKTSEIFSEVKRLGMTFVPYNFHSGWAKQVFVKRQYRDFDHPGVVYRYPPVYGTGIAPDNNHRVHLVFVGTSNFAVAMAVEAAHVLHFPNFNRDQRLKTRITFIDINADREKDEFITRNRHLFEVQPYYYKDLTGDGEGHEESRTEYLLFSGDDAGFLDVEFEFIKGNVFSHRVQEEIRQWAMDKTEYLSIFLPLTDQRQNFVLGMNMPDEVYDNEVPVFIRQDRSDNFVTNLRNADIKRDYEKLTYATVKDGRLTKQQRNARYAHIYPFGMYETAYSADDHSLRRAKLMNYLYATADYDSHRFQSILALDAIPEEQLWAEADKEWHKLSVALQWSSLYNSYTIRTKLATLRAMRGLKVDDTSHDYDPLTDYEVDELAKTEHNRWNVEKLLMGFRKCRPEEDKYLHPGEAAALAGNKKLFIHHDIRPYEQLDNISAFDKDFTRYIPWIMKKTEE